MKKHGSGFFLKAISFLGIAVLALSACGGGSSNPSPPAAPSSVTANPGDNQATLSWSSASGATSYNIYYGTAPGVTKASGTKVSGATSPRVVTPLANGTTYYFVVTAVNSAGESAESAERSATPTSTPPPPAPTGVRAEAGDNTVTVSWDAAAGATSYNIYYGTAAGVTKATGTKITGATSPRVVTPLTNGTTYYFVVTAENANGESAESFEVSGKPTAAPLPPSAPTGVGAAAGNGQATVSWSAVAGATSYNIYHGTAAGVTKATGTKTTGATSPRIVTPLTNGTTYYFVVTAVNANGESTESSEVSATPTAPGAFSQTDLTGRWKVNFIRQSSNPADAGWARFTGTADGSGNITLESVEESDGNTTIPAGTLQWTINGSGVVSESGSLGDDNVHMTMASNKNFIAGTSGGGHFVLRIAQKVVSGTSYSNADLQSKSFVIHNLMVGSDNTWNRQDGTTDASGMISLANDIGPGGDSGGQSNVGTFSVDGSGTVTIDTFPEFKGSLTADKKTIVATFTETDGPSTWHHMMIIQIKGQTYAAGDLVGTSSSHMLGVGNANFWAHYNATVASGGGVTFSSYVDSFGGTTAPSAVTASIDSSSGAVTLAEDLSFHGTMSYDKKFIVSTQTNGAGTYSMSVMTQ